MEKKLQNRRGKVAAVADYVDGAHKPHEIAEIFAQKLRSGNGIADGAPRSAHLQCQNQLLKFSQQVMYPAPSKGLRKGLEVKEFTLFT